MHGEKPGKCEGFSIGREGHSVDVRPGLRVEPGKLFPSGLVPEDNTSKTVRESERLAVGRQGIVWGKVFIARKPAGLLSGRRAPEVDHAVFGFGQECAAVRS